MRNKKAGAKVICLAVITSSILAGCSSNSDLLKMLKNGESIEVVVKNPEYASTEQGTEQEQSWEKLAYKTDNLDFRLRVDDLLNITPYNGTGKNGVIYVNGNGEHTDNSTLYNAFMNQAFIDNYWSKEEVKSELESYVNEVYGDLDSDDSLAAAVNAYWSLFDDSNGADLYFNGSTTLTRAEFLSGMFKAVTPAKNDIRVDEDLVYYLVFEKNIGYVTEMLNNSYLNTEDYSLNDKTYHGSITKAEAIYTVVKMFYNDEFKSTTGKETLDGFENGGDIASEQGFKGKDYNCWKAAELSYAIENDILPNDLYRAMVVADNHELLDDMMQDGVDFEWSEGITKAEAIRLIIDTFETLGKENGYKTNTESGVSNVIDDTLTNDYSDTMQREYDSLDCLKHITYKDGVYSWTEEWKTAMTAFAFFELAPDDVIENFLKEFAEEGYTNRYSGKEVYDRLTKLGEDGFRLYTPPVEEKEPEKEPEKETNNNKNNNSGSQKQESQSNQQSTQEQAPSSDNGNNGNSGNNGSSGSDSGWEDEVESSDGEFMVVPPENYADDAYEELDPNFELIPH